MPSYKNDMRQKNWHFQLWIAHNQEW